MSTDLATREAIEGEEVIDATDGTSLAKIVGAEVDIQISTAHRYPRSLSLAKKRMVEYATIDQETAQGCFYALKRTDREGKIAWITGPSIRMAEIAAACFGNLRTGSRIIDIGEKFVVAQGVCHDLETNNATTKETYRRITTKHGKRFGDDMIGVTANAAASIAMRNAIFTIVPRAIINPVWKMAMKVAEGDERTFGNRRSACLAAFQKLGVKLEEIMTVLDKKNGGVEDITSQDMINLGGLLTAISDNEITVDAAFRPKGEGETEKSKLQDRLDAGAGAKNGNASPPQTGQMKPAKEIDIAAETEAARQRQLKELADVEQANETAGTATDQAKTPSAAAPDPVMENAITLGWDDYFGELQKAFKASGAPGPLADSLALGDAVVRHVVGLGKKGKESSITQEGRRRLWIAAMGGRLGVDGKIAPEKK